METFEIYKLLHILAAIVWVGGGVVTAVFATRLGGAAPEHKLGFARDMDFTSMRVFMPASLLTLVFGILMVIDSDVIEFEQAWIAIGIGAIVVSILIGSTYLGPQSSKLVSELEAGDPAAGPRIKKLMAVHRIDILILLVAVWAMVAKPGL